MGYLMPGIKISDLPSAAAALDAMQLEVNDAGVSRRVTVGQVRPALATVATTGAYSDLSGRPTLGTAAAADTGAFATSAQGALADSAVQPGALATVATSGAYTDLSGTPALATVATTGAYTDLNGRPSLATVATTGAYADLSGRPTLGTAAATDATAYATAAQGALADTAVQPGDDAADLGSGAALDGYVLTADGAGGAAWEVASGGGGGGATDYVRTRSGTTQDIFAMADDWNDAAVTFTGIQLNVTDTASNAASNLLDLRIGGVSRFRVEKNGEPTFGSGGTRTRAIFNTSAAAEIQVGNTPIMAFSSFRLGASVASNHFIGWAGGGNNAPAQPPDIELRRDAAYTLAQRLGTNAQAFNIYNTFTNASNHERARMGWAGNAFQIRPEAAGTGVVRVLHISGLPTSDPGPGILWNDAGTVKVGS
jgi:hypothetical protein